MSLVIFYNSKRFQDFFRWCIFRPTQIRNTPHPTYQQVVLQLLRTCGFSVRPPSLSQPRRSAPKTFLPNLPLEMHNFNIFVDTLYLNTDYNVRVCSFLAPSTKFFIWDLAPLTGLKFRFKLIENYTYDIEQILF